MRFATLREIDDAGQDVRLWCFRCARGARIDANIWMVFEQRGWDDDLEAARRRFPCRACRSSAAVIVLPASRPRRPATSVAGVVAGYFHGMRAAAKREKRRW